MNRIADSAVMRRFCALLALVLSFSLSAGTALADSELQVVEQCGGVDHYPEHPINNAPSVYIWILILSGFNDYIAEMLWVNLVGASGPVSGSGMVEENGIVKVQIPLNSYGKHEFKDFAKSHPDLEHLAGSSFGGTFFIVDSSETTCDEEAMRAKADEMAEAARASTTTTSSTSTTSSTTSTSSTTTTTVASTDTTAASVVAGGPPDQGDGMPIPATLMVSGALIAAAGAFVFFRSGPETVPAARKP